MDTVTLTGQDAHHIANVLRLKAGDRVAVSDGVDKIYEVELAEIGKNRITGIIQNVDTVQPSDIRLTVFQGLPKGKKMDFIVEKLTEIGAARIVPVEMARSVAEYDGARGAKKLDRWRAIGLEAAKQSKRVTIPEISEIVRFKDAAAALKEYDLVVVPWEGVAGTGNHLAGIVSSVRNQLPRNDVNHQVALVIGPEGGFEPDEIDALLERGAVTVTLGRNILRTETAGLVAAALILLGGRHEA